MTASRSTRATKYPYHKLLNGQFNTMTRRKYRYKVGEEEKVVKSIMARARDKDWCVVCRILSDDVTGETFIEVWGDMKLNYKDLPPPEIEDTLREGGYDIRKQRHLNDSN